MYLFQIVNLVLNTGFYNMHFVCCLAQVGKGKYHSEFSVRGNGIHCWIFRSTEPVYGVIRIGGKGVWG